MATQVIMPKLSPTMEEGQLSRWLKKEGDTVSMGEPLAEIDTDKATMEMQALGSGVLRKILIQEGESAPLGQLIAIIGEPDEDISALANQAAASKPAPTEAATSAPAPEPAAEQPAEAPRDTAPTKTAEPAQGNGQQPSAPKPDESGGRLIVSPLAARMAAEAGVDLRSVTGSGPGGRIIKRDVEGLISGAAHGIEGRSSAPASGRGAGSEATGGARSAFNLS